MKQTIKDVFEKLKDQLGKDKGCIIYEELDDDGIELGNWCICYKYDDYEEYTDTLLPDIKDYMNNVNISLNKEYSLKYKSEDGRYYTFKFRFRFVDKCTEQNIVDAVNKDGYCYKVSPSGCIVQDEDGYARIMSQRYGNQTIQ